jgi:hypothetical protein
LSALFTALSEHLTVGDLNVFTYSQIFQDIKFGIGPKNITLKTIIQKNTILILRAQTDIKPVSFSGTGETKCLPEYWSILGNLFVPVRSSFIGFHYLVDRTFSGIYIVLGPFCFEIDRATNTCFAANADVIR